ncbi:hypothetical protein IE81DRAFT_344225 [Ceraceosorus guamensis]|uniref:DUF7330 domain-containing protein n=1 Tax=Ceraceosorus guamensis TaxID=1522189 RepID=A0A316W8D3_9BASI|nr:hypothetical protein IE81DRAFT_344225 [Ceraceosorus guamensis]PWN46170.1 hypothetical protein IE81DRAFT_344225 [Ceraceosorus guamensis]
MSSSTQDTLPPWAFTALETAKQVSGRKVARHIRIEQPSQSIKGIYCISPLVADLHPPIYDRPCDTQLENCSSSAWFEGRGSPVNVTVVVQGDGDEEAHAKVKEAAQNENLEQLTLQSEKVVGQRKVGGATEKRRPVGIHAKSYMGSVRVAIPQYTLSTPLTIRLKSKSGDVHLFLPPSFSGMLSWSTETGKLKLSKAIQERYEELGEKHKHRGVGRLKSAGWTKVKNNHQQPPRPQSASGSAPASNRSSMHLGPHEVASKAEAVEGIRGTRGDSAELITARGDIHIYEAGEATNSTNCIIC